MHQDEFAEARAVCTEIGIAVLASFGERRDFTLESLIDILQTVQGSDARLGLERKHTIDLAIKILASFVKS